MSWMATNRDEVVQRLDGLIQTGRNLAGRVSGRGSNGPDFYNELAGWRARAITAIASIVGVDHPYYAAFESDVPSGFDSSAGHGAAILVALKSDVEAGYLRRQEDLIAAAVFSDFLDMAGHLLDADYFLPAASLIGAVVEDGLRRIADSSGVARAPKDDINALSSKLREKGVFTPLIAKRLTLWAEVRNNVDHGHFDKVKAADVAEMYRGVVDFMAEWLG
jgi:hypothetical protein